MEDATARQGQLVTRAASKVSIFDRLSRKSRDPKQSADEWHSRALQNSAIAAVGAINDAMRCDPGSSKICETLEDPAREFKMAQGTARKAISTLNQYQ